MPAAAAIAAPATVSLRFNRSALRASLTSILRRVQRPFEGASGRRVVALIRSAVRMEFSGGFWLHPSGGRRRWAATHDFGRRRKSARPLRASGAYYGALMGGPGKIEQITACRVLVGASSFYGAIHRGGTGASIITSPVVIRPRTRAASAAGRRFRRGPSWPRQWAMFWRLGLSFSAWLSSATLRRGLRLPRRSHLTRNPETTRRIRDSVAKYVASGRAA